MKKILLLSFFFFSLLTDAQNQDYTYDFSVSTENYQNLENSTSLNNGQYWDDPEYTIPIGFDFQLADKTISTLYIAVGDAVLSTADDFTDNIGLLEILNADLEDRGGGNNSQSPISYKTEGAVGNRIFKMEWRNAGFWDGSTQDFINMQIWLYEGSNKIEYHYGSSNIPNPSNVFEGENGPTVFLIPSYNDSTDGINTAAYLLSGPPASPTANEVLPSQVNSIETTPLNGIIPDGTVYRFTPSTLSTENYEENRFSLYPNPVENEIHISSTDHVSYRFSIYNSLGQLVKENIQSTGNMDVSGLSSGIYFIKIKTANASVIKKFIKK